MSRLCLYLRRPPETDRWLPGDRYVRPLVRRIVRGPAKPGGIGQVFLNLCAGLDRLGVSYVVNPPFAEIASGDRVAILGVGRRCLDGYRAPNPLVAGIGLMTHPSEWPSLPRDHPIACYLQHSEWCAAVYRRFFGELCRVWPVGIDTDAWRPVAAPKTVDLLVYDKIHWERERMEKSLVVPLVEECNRRRLRLDWIRYGRYRADEFRSRLAQARGMLFLSAHESQGLACQQAMAAGVPILAWDPGFVLDPERHRWGDPVIPATSVPYFDRRCGVTFRNAGEFPEALSRFRQGLERSDFCPEDFIRENLTLEMSARRFLSFFDEGRLPSAQGSAAAPG